VVEFWRSTSLAYMKRLTLLVSVALMALVASATQVAPRSLEDKVRLAEHLVVGVATHLEVLDSSHRVIPSPTGVVHGLTFRLTLQPTQMLYSITSSIPTTIQVIYGHKFHWTVEMERQRFVGHPVIYFLNGRGSPYSAIDGFQFAEPAELESKVRDLVNSIKKQ